MRYFDGKPPETLRFGSPKLLRRKFVGNEADTGDVAAGPVDVGDEAIPDRVAPGHKDDRHSRRCSFGRERRRGIAHDQSYLPAKKVRHQKRQPGLIRGRVQFDRDVLALNEACFLEALAQRSHVVRCAGQESHHRQLRLLRARREWPRGCRAAEQHSVTTAR
jgi:hypothetical protein